MRLSYSTIVSSFFFLTLGTACSSLLGLDDFSESRDGNAGTGGVAGNAGTAGVGATGSAGAQTGGTAGIGGTGGSDPYTDCTTFQIDASTFEPFVLMHRTNYRASPINPLGNPDLPDEIWLGTLLQTVGSFDLSDSQEHRMSTCRTCVFIRVDYSDKTFMPVAGTVNIDVISDVNDANHKGEMLDIVLQEVDPANDDEPVEGGSCLRAKQIAWDFRGYVYPDSNIPAINMGQHTEGDRVTLRNVVVTAVGPYDTVGSFWIQQSGGGYSGIAASGPYELTVGDLITFEGSVRPADQYGPAVVLGAADGLISRLPLASTPIVTTPGSSLQEDEWLGALVKLPGPFTVSDATSDNTRFILVPAVGDPVVGSKRLFDPTVELTGFDVGAQVDSITGVVTNDFGERQVIPRDANDLPGFAPVQ